MFLLRLEIRNLVPTCLRAPWVHALVAVCLSVSSGLEAKWPTHIVSFDSHNPANKKTGWFSYIPPWEERGESQKSKLLPEPSSETCFLGTSGFGRDSGQLVPPAKTVVAFAAVISLPLTCARALVKRACNRQVLSLNCDDCCVNM